MIIIPIKKGSKHFERTINGFIYRYGYQPIQGEAQYVSAVIEETRTKLSEADIRQRVTRYCTSVGITNEYDQKDYGY